MKATIYNTETGEIRQLYDGPVKHLSMNIEEGEASYSGFFSPARYVFDSLGNPQKRSVTKPNDTATHEAVWSDAEWKYVMQPKAAEQLRIAKKQQAKKEIESVIDYNGMLFDADPVSVAALGELIVFLSVTSIVPNHFKGWRDAHNQMRFVDLGYRELKDELVDLYTAIQERKQRELVRSWEITE